MKLEAFFEKFDQFADAPGAVAKMRQLVLQLAVQGKLVRQDSQEETAAKLILRAVRARKELVAARIVREETRDLNFLSSEEELPTGWVRARLSTYVGVIMGQSPPSSTYNTSGDGLPFYQGKSQFGRFNPVAADWCTKPAKVGEPGDVIISVRAPVGPTNVLREKSCIGRGLASLRSLGGDQMHLLYTLRAFERSISSLGVGSTFIAISKSDLDNFRIPIPPLAEQKRIVAKVDELMALCDQLETQQKERETRHAALARASLSRFADAPTPANLNFLFHNSYIIPPADLRKSILAVAVQGKLVPQDPHDEPADNLIERVSRLRGQRSAAQRDKTARRLKDLDASKCTHDIPQSWAWSRLGELVLDFRYGTSRKCVRGLTDGTPVLRIPNIQNGRVEPTDLKFTHMPKAEFEELRLRRGDLLLVRSNGSENLVGRSAVAKSGDERFAYAGYLVRARLPMDEVFVPFVHLALSAPSVRDQIEIPIRTTSGVKNINTTELSNVTFPLPPLAEQRRIVVKVDQLMALVDDLETGLSASRCAAAKLLDAIVGELTA